MKLTKKIPMLGMAGLLPFIATGYKLSDINPKPILNYGDQPKSVIKNWYQELEGVIPLTENKYLIQERDYLKGRRWSIVSPNEGDLDSIMEESTHLSYKGKTDFYIIGPPKDSK